MKRILVAVDDSPQALAAADVAITLAGELGAELRLVTMAGPRRDPEPALRWAAERARAAGLAATSQLVADGRPYEALLGVAREWRADLIVMGRSDTRRPGTPHVGSQTEHLLEFTEVPVLVVPHVPI